MIEPRGFSLAELLVTVAIITLLVAIALPQFKNYSLKAKRAEGYGLLQATFKAELSYFAGTDQFFWGSGDVLVSRMGLPRMKFYRENTFWIWDTDVLYPLGGQFGVFLLGDLDGNDGGLNDFLCLVYPRDPDGSCDCNASSTPPGVVIVLFDDIRNQWCHEIQ